MRTIEDLIEDIEWNTTHGFGWQEITLDYNELYALICHFKNNNEKE